MLVESEEMFRAGSDFHDYLSDSQDFLDKCDEGLLSAPFPAFICPLLQLHSASLPIPVGPLNSTYVEIYNEAVRDHPCNHTAGLSCVVLFLPLNRILFGCSQLDGDILRTPSDFNETFVVAHRVADGQKCEYDAYGESVCSTESVFLRGLVVQEQHSCCCHSGRCAVLYFDQGPYLLPFIRIVIDVEDIFQETRRKREAPLTNAGGTADVVLGGGLFVILAAVVLYLWYSAPDIDVSDGQEAMAYGLHPEIITVMFPRPTFAYSLRAPSSQSEQRAEDKEEAKRKKEEKKKEEEEKKKREEKKEIILVDSDTVA